MAVAQLAELSFPTSKISSSDTVNDDKRSKCLSVATKIQAGDNASNVFLCKFKVEKQVSGKYLNNFIPKVIINQMCLDFLFFAGESFLLKVSRFFFRFSSSNDSFFSRIRARNLLKNLSSLFESIQIIFDS